MSHNLRTCCVVLGVLLTGFFVAPAFGQETPSPGMPQTESGFDPHVADEQAAERQALGFVGYLDSGRFADSYAYTGMLIRAKVDRDFFAKQIEKARAGTGALQGRDLIDALYTTSVPGAPAGQYVVLHYHTLFATRGEVVETLTLDFARGYWRVSGYYIK